MTQEMMRTFKKDKVPLPQMHRPPLEVLFKTYAQRFFEIGSGVGYFALRFAENHPDALFIACEHTRSRFQSLERRIQNHPKTENLLPLHCNAISALSHWILPESLDGVFLNYPNPNLQNPAMRWFRMPFFSELLQSLKPDGFIQLLTNNQFYFEEAKKFSRETWNLEILEDFAFNKDSMPAPQARTHFEKKYLERGETCFQLKLQKLRKSSSVK